MAKASKRLPKPGEFIFKIDKTGPGFMTYYMVYAVKGDSIRVWSVGKSNPGPWGSWKEWVSSGWRVGQVPQHEPRLSHSYMEAMGIAHGRTVERAHIVQCFRELAGRIRAKMGSRSNLNSSAANSAASDLEHLASMLEKRDPKFQ